ncbi:hypothetical protein HYH02_012847 [Chlamydomonas schloesseri]|uniref:Oxysterol-binding protein n=2 Tax=Chlamydomonas schloesseri TaxID=2026947 RepID=A0A835T7T4_9CHLO|nr:hypothetical protein HYH02_012847 [Chlamydomonas schloesseri]|eukprot:KAG2433146.1 hypothetical protein HYH02_012847 [Chlamydomonas schloesseri]
MFKLGKSKKKASDAPSTQSNGSAGAAVVAAEEEIAYHADADENGGMVCTNDELLKQQREAIMQWVKSMGKRLLTGNVNLINTPFPVNIFEPRSYLEKLADVWVYPRYLTAAAQATDPVERMKLVTTWFIAGLHHAFANWRKPFNPILGETWQAALSDGTTMFMEQISHHPPVSAFHMEGPGGSYRFRGLSQPTVSIQVKYYGFKTVAKGFRYVEFRDGTRIELHYPQYYIKNVVYGSSRPRAEVDGQAILVDVRNKLKTVIHFGALKGARSRVLRRVDAVHGYIYDCRHNQASLEEKTSTADMAEALEEAGLAASRQRGAAGPGGPGSGEGPGSGDADDEEFESASENEYDPDKEEGDATAALERAAAEAAEAAAAAEEADAIAAVESANGTNDALLGPDDVRDSSGPASRTGASPPRPGGSARGSLSGEGAGLGPSLSSGLPKLDGSTHGSGVGGKGHGGGGGSFFSMSALNSMGKLLRITQAPSPSNLDPTPSEKEGVAVAAIEGSWLSHVSIDGVRYWSINKEVPDSWRPVPDPLPSDSRYRQDLVVLAGGDMKGAQAAKEALENRQRHDKKLREAALASGSRSYRH